MAKAQQLVCPALPIGVKSICFVSLGLFLLGSCMKVQQPETLDIPLGSPEIHTIYQGLYEAATLPPQGKTPLVPVLIVPHHLTAAVTIAAGIQSLQRQKPTSILLLSPDHFNACPNMLCTGNINITSVFGKTEPDAGVLSILNESPLVSEINSLFQREHGIHAVAPFIAHLSPGTRVTPLVVAIRPDWKAQREEMLTLLRRSISDNVTLVVSSDFSHYLSLREAESADEKSAIALFTQDFDAISRLENPSQSDCPACLWLAARIADMRNAYNPSVLLHTNSALLLKEESSPSTTSHFAIAFYENATLLPEDAAFAGDVTLTRATTGSVLAPPSGVRAFWAGTGPRLVNVEGPLQEHCIPHGNPYIFCNSLSLWRQLQPVATHWGIENNHKLDQGKRGYKQTPLLIEQEGEISVSEEGTLMNGMKVYALTNVMNPVSAEEAADLAGQYKRVIDALRTGSSSTLPQVVFVHAGTEYRALLSEREIKYLRSFIDNGANAVIAAHSHVPSGMEMYKGAPIFQGLGNFIFDQRDKVETSTTKVVRIRPEGKQILFETRTAK